MKTGTLHKLVGCAAALCLSLIPALATAQHAPHWGYTGEDGPANWGKLDPAFAVCTTGKRQSPIDIKGAEKADLPALHFDYKAAPLNIVNNGHTIQINYAPGSTLTVGDKTYTLKQFHFHRPSEEEVNGRRYDMVIHLVHADAQGHLAVVAVLLTKGATNAFLEPIWKNMPAQQDKSVDVPGVTVDAKELLPTSHGYFTFDGSLTTPPCSEGVTWYVLKHTVTVSPEQIAAFAKLYPMNARPIQPVDGRQILATE